LAMFFADIFSCCLTCFLRTFRCLTCFIGEVRYDRVRDLPQRQMMSSINSVN
jgi:hypothetical protein